MKRFILSIFIITVTVLICISSQMFLKNTTEYITEVCGRIEESTLDEDFYESAKLYSELADWWQKRRKILSVISDHQHINDADTALSQMRAGVLGEDSTELLISVASMRTEIESLYKNERLILSNIF